MGDAGFARRGEREQVRTADEHGLRAERQRRQHIGRAPDAAVQVDLDATGHGLDDLLQHVDRRRTRSSWRPPWFETTIAAAPCSTASAASSPVMIPFTISGSDDSPWSQPRSSQLRAGFVNPATNSWKAMPGAPSSARLAEAVRVAQLVAQVPLPISGQRQVHRQDDGAIPGSLGSADDHSAVTARSRWT